MSRSRCLMTEAVHHQLLSCPRRMSTDTPKVRVTTFPSSSLSLQPWSFSGVLCTCLPTTSPCFLSLEHLRSKISTFGCILTAFWYRSVQPATQTGHPIPFHGHAKLQGFRIWRINLGLLGLTAARDNHSPFVCFGLRAKADAAVQHARLKPETGKES